MRAVEILIVQDQKSVELGLENLLRRQGYHAQSVDISPEEATQRVHALHPNLVLMTVGDGAALRDVAAAEAYRARLQVPVLYLLDCADDEMIRKAQETDPFGYLTVPFDDVTLSGAVQTALQAQQMRKALQASEGRYRLLSEVVSDVIWTTDFDLMTRDVTSAVSRLLGCSAEEALREGMTEWLTPASLDAARTATAELRATAEPELGVQQATKRLELAFVSHDGTTILTEARAALVVNDGGVPRGLLWVIQHAGQQDATDPWPRSRPGRLGSNGGSIVHSVRPEKTLRATADELESRSQSRLAQLERAQVELTRAFEARKRAEAKLGELNREWLSLQSAAAATASSLDLQFVLDTVTWEMTELLTVEGCAVFQWDQERDTISAIADYASSRGYEHETVGEACQLKAYPLRRRVLRERYAQQVTIDELEGVEGERAYMERHAIESMLMLPMIYQDRVIGLVEMRSSQAHRHFTDREISLAQMLSTEAASAIENARLYRRAQREIAHRKRVEEELKTSLHEKEALLQEIHHRVKNNLQVICSLLNLQSRSIEDEDALQMFRESQDRVRSMALIHEKLYRSRDMARVDFSDYLRNLTNHLVRSYRPDPSQIALNISTDDVPLSLEKAVPCGLITNELISNAMKHAFPHGRDGEIRVRLRSGRDQRLTLSVADDGVGLPADLDVETSQTLGLQLIRVLTSQLGGTAELKSSPEKGTEVSVTFSAS